MGAAPSGDRDAERNNEPTSPGFLATPRRSWEGGRVSLRALTEPLALLTPAVCAPSLRNCATMTSVALGHPVSLRCFESNTRWNYELNE